jgi:hypothetical protein
MRQLQLRHLQEHQQMPLLLIQQHKGSRGMKRQHVQRLQTVLLVLMARQFIHSGPTSSAA